MKPVRYDKSFRSKQDFVSQYVDLFTALGVEYRFQLSRAEKAFFVKCVLYYSKGYKLSDSRVTEQLQADYAHTKDPDQSVYQYRMKLKKKGWLRANGTPDELAPLIHFRDVPMPWALKFDLNFEVTGTAEDIRTDSPEA